MMKPLFSCVLLCLSAAVFSAPSAEDIGKFKDYLKMKRQEGATEESRKQLRKRYFAREQLSDAIESEGQLDEALIQAELREFEKNIRIHKYFDAYLDEAVTKQDVKDYYQNNKSLYKYKKINASHILFRVKDSGPASKVKEVKKAAQDVLAQINSNGSNFAELARAHSKDSRTKLKGGDLGWVKEGIIDEDFSKKLFKLTVDSGPTLIKSSWGFHIVLVRENAEKITQKFSDVRATIENDLRKQAKKAELQRLKSL